MATERKAICRVNLPIDVPVLIGDTKDGQAYPHYAVIDDDDGLGNVQAGKTEEEAVNNLREDIFHYLVDWFPEDIKERIWKKCKNVEKAAREYTTIIEENADGNDTP